MPVEEVWIDDFSKGRVTLGKDNPKACVIAIEKSNGDFEDGLFELVQRGPTQFWEDADGPLSSAQVPNKVWDLVWKMHRTQTILWGTQNLVVPGQ